MRKFHFPKFMQLLVLLAVVLFNFGPAQTGVAHAVNCYTLTLVNNPVAGGIIDANPLPNCNGGTQYTEGTVVTLTGLPEPGYVFGTWQGAVSGIVNPTNVAMSADKTVTAIYMADQWQKAIDVNAPYSITVDTRLASYEPVFEPQVLTCEGIDIKGGLATIWFKYTAPANALVSLDTVGSFQSAVNPQTGKVDAYDTYISVWTGTIDATPADGNPVLVACNDDNNLGYVSQLGFNAVAGTTYYIQVAQYRSLPNSTADPYYNGGTLNFHVGFGTQVQAFIGDMLNEKGTYTLLPGESTRQGYTSTNTGPVKLISNNTVPLVAAERVIYNVGGVNTSFTEMMGLSDSLLSTTYWLPFYNNVDLDTQLRFGNVSGSNATVRVYIGGIEQSGCTSTPSKTYPYVLVPGESVRVSCVGVSNGPVKVTGTVPIVAAERVIYRVNNINTSFSEMMGLPESQLNTTYWLPFYNNVDLDTQLRFGNVSGAAATVRLYIGGIERSTCTSTPAKTYPYSLAPGESLRVSCVGVSSGPVRIVGTQNIVAAERVIYKVNGVNTSFTESMALPESQLSTTYHLPFYNNVDLDTQLRFGNVSASTATVRVFIGGAEMSNCTSTPAKTYPYSLTPGESVRVSCVGIRNGPVRITSDQNIVAAERVIYTVNGVNTSFSEMMGLPNGLLDTVYWFPYYNNVDLDTQLRFAVP